jgi:hypothetical protein
LAFLDSEIRSKLKCVKGTPVLSSTFESSVPGLYFVGLAAANSFGPVMRFAFGAGFAATRVTQAMTKSLARNSASVPAASMATTAGWPIEQTSRVTTSDPAEDRDAASESFVRR